VCNLSVATNEVWKDKQGQKQERVEWHRVNVWGDQAEHCSKYLAKGRMVYVEGRIQTRKWQDKEGKDRYTTEVVADRVVFLGGQGQGPGAEGSGGGGGGGSKKRGWGEESQTPAAADGPSGPPPSDDDIPF
jgi:single-strand DNA-binding protein